MGNASMISTLSTTACNTNTLFKTTTASSQRKYQNIFISFERSITVSGAEMMVVGLRAWGKMTGLRVNFSTMPCRLADDIATKPPLICYTFLTLARYCLCRTFAANTFAPGGFAAKPACAG